MTNNKIPVAYEKIKEKLTTKYIGRNLYFFNEVTSTFDESDKLYPENGTVVCAKTQTNGRGRLGRKWQSNNGGIYFSVILKNRFAPEKLQLMTAVCALGVQKALSEYLQCKIKWPNDIISANGMKLCGILTKLRTESETLNYINAGIGINANSTDFAEDLPYASSLRIICGYEFDENEVLCNVLKSIEECLELSEEKLIEEYSRECITVGSNVRIVYANGENEFTGKCTGINADGSLSILEENGTLTCVNSGEVSVRGVYGENYV